MASKVNICSMACTLIGANRVTDLDNPTTEEERLCVLWWDQVLEETLHEHDWKFAREYKAALAVSASPSGEYDHAYQLPSDCLVLRYLWDTDAADRVVADEYEIQGTQILTDLDTVNVVYTKRDANVGRYPTFFVRALTYLLAHYLAFKLSEKGLSEIESVRLDCAKARYGSHGGSWFAGHMGSGSLRSAYPAKAGWSTVPDFYAGLFAKICAQLVVPMAAPIWSGGPRKAVFPPGAINSTWSHTSR